MPFLRTFAAIAFLAALTAGCGDSDDGGGPTPLASPAPTMTAAPASTPSGDPAASALAVRALDASLAADAYTVESRLDVTTGDQVQRSSTTVRFATPGRYLTETDTADGRVQILSSPPLIFVRRVDGEWFVADRQSDPSVAVLARNEGLRTYLPLFERLEDVQPLDEESIDGQPHEHIRGRFDVADYIATLPPGSVTDETVAAARVAEPATLDIWIDPETERIRRLLLRLQLRVDDVAVIFVGALDVTGYDDPSGFPSSPSDPPPFRGFDDDGSGQD